jgi:O-Antigen ligase
MNYSGLVTSSIDRNDKILTVVNVICLTILMYLYRATVPFLKFPFLILFIGLLIYSVIFHFKQIPSAFKEFLSNFYLVILLVIIFISSFFLSNKLYLASFKDIFNAAILLILFFLMTLYIKTRSQFNLFFKVMVRYIIIFGILISFALLYSFLNFIPGSDTLSLNKSFWHSDMGELSSDFNFGLIPVFFGMIGAFYTQIGPITSLRRGMLNVVLLIYSIVILFSGSRRGLIVFIGLVIILMVLLLLTIVRKYDSLKIINRISKLYLVSLFFLLLILFGFIFVFPTQLKKKTLNSLGISVSVYKYIVSTRLYKYSTIYSNLGYSHFQNIIWNEKLDPLNPRTGWDIHIGTMVTPLIGENAKIVPKNSVGFKMDSTCDASTWNNNAYSYINISNFIKSDSIATDNELYCASVYCYVSKDFDGTWVTISDIDGLSGEIVKQYDMNKKGIWQRLQLSFKNKTAIFLYFAKYGVTDFSSLKGYVIFAYPQYRIITRKDSISFFLHNRIHNKPKDIVINNVTELTKTDFAVKIKSDQLRRNNFFDNFYTTKSKQIPIYKQNIFKKCFDSYQVSASLFPFTMIQKLNLSDQDPIRKWALRFISEDTTYYGYKQNLVVDTMSNKFLAGRLLRWQFAWQIFTKEYNWRQKLFGGGFNFLNWFGYRFLNDKKASDYPHNPFLSVLLYSGIVGLLIYLVFFYKAVYYYIKYIREYPILAIFFAITFFFSFFSAGSPFDPPIMGFFMILPFFAHHIHKNYERINQPIDNL